MRVLPRQIGGLVQFARAHYPVWEAQSKFIGLTPEQVQALTDLTKQTSELREAALRARDASQAATTAMKAKAQELRDFTAALVATIKAYATPGGQGGPDPVPEGDIYAAAQLPMPQRAGV